MDVLRIGIFVVVVAAVGLGMDNPYYLQMLTILGIHTLLALGLNLLMGYAGQISLGHAAFYGIGAYTTAILSATLGLSPWLSLPCALAIAAIVALAVGYPTLKLTGYYLGMGTLGFGMIVFILIREWSEVTGGSSGFVGIPPLSIGGAGLDSPAIYFFLVWGVVLLGFFLAGRLIRSRIGCALMAIHDSEPAAGAVGIHTSRLKLQVFVLSAVVSALAGFLYAHMVGFISPGSFDFMVSVKLVTMVVIGGMASIWGALLGASLLTLLPELLHAFAEYEMVVYGGILILVMVFMPQGLTRGFLDLYERAKSASGRG
ncbi:MAG: branched-chain amino acid ABC transporter permease [Desulfobacterales bacterium]